MRVDGSAHPVVVIGGGQAGLSMSHCLTRLGIGHVVLERGRVGESWRSRRWDSFCLVTPNWQCDLPGYPYQGGEPDGFMVRAEIVSYLEGYAASFAPPVVERVTASRLTALEGGFAVTTDRGTLTAGQVVVATGPYQTPVVPRVAERLGVPSLHSDAYRGPADLPEGPVLVVGSGQSGCQIAEDLFLAGRTVHLAVGSAPRVARRYRGRDVVEWLDLMGYYDRPITEFDDPDAVRARANHYVTGRDGGRDIDLRAFARDGMRVARAAHRGHRGLILEFAGRPRRPTSTVPTRCPKASRTPSTRTSPRTGSPPRPRSGTSRSGGLRRGLPRCVPSRSPPSSGARASGATTPGSGSPCSTAPATPPTRAG